MHVTLSANLRTNIPDIFCHIHFFKSLELFSIFRCVNCSSPYELRKCKWKTNGVANDSVRKASQNYLGKTNNNLGVAQDKMDRFVKRSNALRTPT